MNPDSYGYLWWLLEEGEIFAYLSLGDGGHVICFIPEKDLVVVILLKMFCHDDFQWLFF
ncbi:beta-lactamase class C and other penicillin binding proteins [Paenibacillus pini JCM 16418]|uniref:Beta-lactamase class C and other penicillin binding proteins n=1 Tax=Paenibacillus pini JCM 16418 TaxID=1236976 RepID=W7YT83_9BACL|nr:beta-lactamase class C and other penicillin binding proteins [Paenibacillus pini JCM 16418]